jgi:AcrR family transcriptional regulator
MVPGPPSEQTRRPPGRPRREGLDDAILEAAAAELGRVGYARMTLDAVAQRAGTTKTTLYTRYASKAALATAALESMRRQTPRELTGDVRADLVAELTLFRQGALRPNGMSMLGAVLAEEHETPELLDLFRRHVVLPRRENLRRILRAGVDSGQVRADADLELGIAMLVGSLYATYVAGRQVRASWPERAVDAWLEGNRA